MNVKVEFSETSQEFDVAAHDNSATFPADMGQTTVLYNGQNGATFIPKVSESGVLSWTNDKGLPNPEPVNIKGDKGGKGDAGTPGKDGADGYTPIKGTDYFTEADKAEMVSAVIAALPVYDGEVVAE